jgi:NAD(P)-dependent dehydrogenase (short-subunit alcohol dehydrogenase family)
MKWTLVTGGSKRLGAATSLALAKRGNPVLIHYRNSRQEAEAVAAACKKFGVDAEVIQGDFSTLESTMAFIEKCLKSYPEMKTLINNVGNYLIKSAAETTPEEWNALFQSNVNAPFALCRSLLPSLRACRGNIINIGVAGANNIHADVKRTAYMAAKMSLLMLTKSLARELAPFQVRVNMVSPGYLENAVDLPNAKMPMQRPASLDEVLNAIFFLLDEENSYITGQNIEVSGGLALMGNWP